jgi:hypothetical protein
MKFEIISNRSKVLFSLLAIVSITSSCKKALDINHDPNNPTLEQGNPRLVFPAAVMATAGRVGGDLAILGGMWSQNFTQSALANQYKDIDSYDVKSTDLNLPYSGLFTGGLKNYQFVIDKSAAAKDWNFYLMATVMKAYTTEVLVDLYDKIPYSEALGGAPNLNPHFDNGDNTYTSLIAEIDGALGKDFGASTNTSPGNSDLVFQGDIDKWKRFANTLELKMYLRMINAKPADAQAGVQKLYTNGAKFLSTDAGVFGFSDEPGLDNPLYEQNIRQLNVGTNLRASRTFVSWLMANSDSRIVSYFGSATPNSINQGDYLGSDPTYGTAAVFVEHPTDPVIFISKAESYFLQAEARERFYLGDNAKALYDNGVLASFQSVNQNGSQFIGAGKVYEYPAGGSLAQKIEAIVVQKWASFPYGAHFIESFFEKQRTGFPTTSPVYSTDVSYVPGEFVISKNSVLSIGKLPRRLVFPDVEVSRNTNTPALVPITESVWWAKP